MSIRGNRPTGASRHWNLPKTNVYQKHPSKTGLAGRAFLHAQPNFRAVLAQKTEVA
jgi:hypothetical protein